MKSLMLAVKSPMHAGPLVESGPAHFAGLNSNCSAARYSIVATASRQFDYPIKLAKRDHPVLATISRLRSRRMSWKIILREHSGIFSDRSNWVSWRNRLKCKHLRNTPSRSRTYNLRFRRPMLYPVELWVHGGRLCVHSEIRMIGDCRNGVNWPEGKR